MPYRLLLLENLIHFYYQRLLKMMIAKLNDCRQGNKTRTETENIYWYEQQLSVSTVKNILNFS